MESWYRRVQTSVSGAVAAARDVHGLAARLQSSTTQAAAVADCQS